MVSSERRLTTWLSAKSTDELRRILARAGFTGDRDVTPRQLARLLLQPYMTPALVESCTLPEIQALSAVAWLATRRHGAPGAARWHAEDPADRAVPRAEVIDLLAGADRQARADAEATLDALAGLALVLPPHGDRVIVPYGVHVGLADAAGLGRPAADLLTAYHNAPEVHRLAATLGFPKAGNRATAQGNVLGLLGDPGRLRALLDEASASVRDHLDTVVRHGSQIRTHAYEVSYDGKARFRDGGSGDPDTDWLAARGLLLPSGAHDVAEVPVEVALAVMGEPKVPFSPRPPQPPAGLPAAPRADGSAQAAVTAALSQIERLLATCADQPPALRKAGGVAVRDAKRVAKAAGVPDDLARFWLDLAARARLLSLHADPVVRPKGHRGRLPDPTVNLLPTRAYDRWLKRPPAERLAPILAAWATVPATFTYWPFPDETPVALTEPDDPHAVSTRHALFEALAVLPPGRGAGDDALPYLLARAHWHRPQGVAALPDAAERIAATLREAELLGVVAGGTLTDLGHAVLGLLRSDTPPDDAPAAALARMLPQPQASAFFQADLTAVVRGIPTAELATLLDESAARESEGHAVVWRFAPATVRRAFDIGHDADTLLARLTEVSEVPLPQPLEYLIKDVGRTHGRIRVVRSGCCIRSDDETLIDELSRTRALGKLGFRKIAPTVLISSAGEDETLASLRRAGYTPVLEAESGATVIERPARRRASQRR